MLLLQLPLQQVLQRQLPAPQLRQRVHQLVPLLLVLLAPLQHQLRQVRVRVQLQHYNYE